VRKEVEFSSEKPLKIKLQKNPKKISEETTNPSQ
jgi:hypothetical protein